MDWFLSLLITKLFWFINGQVYSGTELMRLQKVLPTECGENFNENRIIGGDEAGLGQYPWIARVGYSLANCSDQDKFVCGGSLVTDRYIVSAAHCITDVMVLPCVSKPGHSGMMKINSILLGEHDERTYVDCVGDFCAPPAQYFKIVRAAYHALYNDPNSRNDISVFKIDRPAIYNEFVFPICLPLVSVRPSIGSWIEVAGWGMTNMTTLEVSKTLQRVSIPLVENAVCSDIYKFDEIEIDDTQICAGGLSNKDSCGGDSGGPLMRVSVHDGSPRQYLMGVVSFGKSVCGAEGLPAIYTDVNKYIHWILHQIQI